MSDVRKLLEAPAALCLINVKGESKLIALRTHWGEEPGYANFVIFDEKGNSVDNLQGESLETNTIQLLINRLQPMLDGKEFSCSVPSITDIAANKAFQTFFERRQSWEEKDACLRLYYWPRF
ncbi:hypothetical protein FWF48_01100 [Candidatus Saccharibacteria bacterium]|nr:hypothetical protein [Candidatus Saccharibacteria bacterium]